MSTLAPAALRSGRLGSSDLGSAAQPDRGGGGTDGQQPGQYGQGPSRNHGCHRRCAAHSPCREPPSTASGCARAVGRGRALEGYLSFEWVLANIADGIYGIDTQGLVEFVNPAATRITGYPFSEQRGRDQHDLLRHHRQDGTPYPREECPVWQALIAGQTIVAENELFWRRDGSSVPVDLVAVPTVESGSVTGAIVSFRDLTERRAAEEQATALAQLSREAATQRALADRLQRALLTPPPEPDHLHIAVRYQAAEHEAVVGGDWYDAFLQPDGATMLVIGDVVGHGSVAAAAMGQLRGVLRTLA